MALSLHPVRGGPRYNSPMGNVDVQVITRACNTRSHHIIQLKNLAEEIDLLYNKFNQNKIKSSGASLTGGGLTVISGVLTITTGGLAIPILGAIGTAVGVAGGVWNYISANKKEEMEKEIIQRIKKVQEDDIRLQEEIQHEIRKFEMLDDSKQTIVLEQILTILRGWGGVALVSGPEAAMYALTFSLIPIGELFANIPFVMAVLGAAAQGGQAVFVQGAKEVADETIQNAVKKAGEHLPNNWTKKFILENSYGEIIKKGKDQFVQLSKEGAAALADDAAKAIAAETAKMAKIVGGITIGLGAISCIWDVCQIAGAWQGTTTKTKLGEALKRIASQLEASRRSAGG